MSFYVHCNINPRVETVLDMERALENVSNLTERCSLYFEGGDIYFEDWELDLAKKSYFRTI